VTVVCTEGMFVLAVPLALRLSLLPGPSIPLDMFLTGSVPWLVRLEKDLSVPSSGRLSRAFTDHTSTLRKLLPPHPAPRLFDVPDTHFIEVWGECVEALWRIAMTRDAKCEGWDELTCRLLVWRSIAGENRSVVGEWARKEVLRNLNSP